MEDHGVDALAVEAAAEAAALEARPVAVHGPGSRERHPSLGASFPHSDGLPEGVADSNPTQVLQCPHLKDGWENIGKKRKCYFFPIK